MKWIYSFLSVVLMFLYADVQASYITLISEFHAEVRENRLMVRLSIRNKGDEPAHRVQLKAVIGDQEQISPVVAQLGVNQETQHTFEFTPSFPLAGHYPVITKIYYQDANSYQFTSLLINFYDHQTPVIADVVFNGKAIEIPLNREGKLEFSVRNTSDQPRNLQMVLYTPDELQAEAPTKTVSLGPREETTVGFQIKNFSGLQNSNYAVFLVAQYEVDNKHYTASCPSTIKITHAKPALFSFPPVWVIVVFIAVLLILFIALQFRIRKNSK